MKFILNRCYGGFSISMKAVQWLVKHKNWTFKQHQHGWIVLIEPHTNKEYELNSNEPAFRSHPDLIECVETLGKDANGKCAKLEITDLQLDIEDYHDGYEKITLFGGV